MNCARPSTRLTRIFAVLSVAMFAVISPLPANGQDPQPPPISELPGLDYTVEFFPGTRYDPAVPTPESILGFPVGQRFASPDGITRCLQAWDQESSRTTLVEYARSHEDRPLHYLVITSPENLVRLDRIKAGMARLADPRGLDRREADRLVAELPTIGWFSYTIHGNETSGSDAALAAAYHLTAATGSEIETMLDEMVIVIDPLQNPDGRNRFHQQTVESRGNNPNVDDQSLLHRGGWPSGRVNHYLFDLNRDYLFGIHPETRGRLRAFAQWYPLLMVDGHEMGPQATYLFSPSRDPINPHHPESRFHWADIFANDQGAAFDAHGWPYYTGEWVDEWYIGYTSMSVLRGSVFILYEQARVAEDAVRQQGGRLLPYRQAVHQQLISTMANLSTLHTNGRDMLREFAAERRAAVAADGPYAGRTFAVLPTLNRGRLARFVELMDLVEVETYVLDKPLKVKGATDQLGRIVEATLPTGTLLVPNRQPEASLIAAMLEFDTQMNEYTLKKERQEILRGRGSRMYDTTAWNITMLYGLEALTLPRGLPADVSRLVAPQTRSTEPPADDSDIIGLCLDGADDRSVAAAARLLERGIEVRIANRAFTFGGQDFSRGTVVVPCNDNRALASGAGKGQESALTEAVEEVAGQLDLPVLPISSGMGAGDLPDIGGRHFRRLEPPRIAVATRGGISIYDFGTVWHALDQVLGIRHSHLDEDRLGGSDLRRYNVLVMPNRWFGELQPRALDAVRSWVSDGGTLIAIGGSATAVTRAEAKLGTARNLPDVLGELDKYEMAILNEWLASIEQIPAANRIWSHTVEPDLDLPWQKGKAGAGASKEELEKQDRWLRQFSPQGAILASRVDQEHWLTVGCGEYLPVLTGSAIGRGPLLMAAERVEAPIRFGYLVPDSKKNRNGKNEDDTTANRVGFATVPDGQRLHLRMSGLLWPEAAHRLANTAYVTRERVGRGQIILFASPPNFRAGTLGTQRLLVNALIYGPGCGANHPIEP